MKFKHIGLSILWQVGLLVSGIMLFQLDRTRTLNPSHELLFWVMVGVLLISGFGAIRPTFRRALENDRKAASVDVPITHAPDWPPEHELAYAGDLWDLVDEWAVRSGFKVNAGSTQVRRFYKKRAWGLMPAVIAIERNGSSVRITTWAQPSPDPNQVIPLAALPRLLARKELQKLLDQLQAG